MLPIAIVAGIGAKYLRALPSGTWPHLLEIAGVGVGLVFGLASIAFVKVGKDPETGALVTRSGWAYATTWLAALALRLGFGYGSTHWFSHALGAFSVAHYIPASTYCTAFVLMVLAMIVVRTVGVVANGKAAGATIDTSTLRLGRRLAGRFSA